MAKKPSPAELKTQGVELGKTLAAIRKAEHNFAMQIGKEGIVFMADKKKPADALWRIAKKEGGSSKGAKGTCTMKGKNLVIDCDEPDKMPSSLPRLAKVYFAERGQPAKVVLVGEEEEEDENQTEDADAEGGEEAAGGGGAEAGGEGGGEGGGEAAAEGGEEGGGGQGESPQQRLQAEFEELQPDLEAVEASPNKGLVKKVGGLKTMFESVLESDQKKATAIIGLLKTTLDTAREAGDLPEAGAAPETPPAEGDAPAGETAEAAPAEGGGEAGTTAPSPEAQARREKLAELERGVDALLAEFA
ncbi:MAG: hypothetical protein AB8B60_08970 [Sulfitobacter sp.]